MARSASSVGLASLFALCAWGCSLLAPSRDELSGGKVAALDAEAPVADASDQDVGDVSPTNPPDGADGEMAEAADAAGDAPVNVLDCSSLKGAGVWEPITPPEVVLACPPNGANCGGRGVQAFVLDPVNSGTIYLGTREQGLWKSTNCGTTWSMLNTGTNSIAVGAGMQSMFEIDPVDPKVMYTLGIGQAGYKSVNGGVDWERFWPPSDMALANIVQYNQVDGVAIDPLDHRHILVIFRGACSGQYPPVCFAESKDGGETFTMLKGKPDWKGANDGHLWMLDANSWLYSNPADGLWRTSDRGVTWQQLSDRIALNGDARGRLLRADDGSFYLGSRTGILRSRDGLVWTVNTGPGPVMSGVVSDGTSLYATTAGFCFVWGMNLDVYWTSPLSDGKTWTKMSAPTMTQGGVDLAYDRQHHILYSSNCQEGFWRVVTQ